MCMMVVIIYLNILRFDAITYIMFICLERLLPLYENT